MRLLITGASGFIGGASARALADGNEVWGWSRTYSERAGIPRERYVEADVLAQPADLPPFDVIVHCAGVVAPGDALAAPMEAMRVNAAGTARIFELARASGGAVVLASSVYVYDGSSELPWDESTRLDPISPLGASKLGAEAAAIAFWRCFSVPSILLRIFTVYGPGAKDSSFMASAIRKIAGASGQVEFGPGESTRDFIYIDDVVGAIRAAVAKVQAVRGAEAVNVASGRERSIRDAAHAIARVLGKGDLALVFEKLPVRPDEKGSGHSRHAALTAKAKRLLGWEASVEFEEGIRRALASGAGTLS
ncbi:MAG: NAD(P)-dependent oxidoreductase [Chloroflexi bacterium]|nr:NAD(P)-dependent oxidoreductase [Chloroflexota bacterium]